MAKKTKSGTSKKHVKTKKGMKKPSKKPTGTKKPEAVKPRKRTIDQGFEEFGEDMGKLGKRLEHHGKRFGEHMEKKGKDWESSWDRNFGIMGPFISSIIGLIAIAIAIWILNMINIPIGSNFIRSVYDFVFANLGIFFGFFLFCSYTSYISKKYRNAFMPISPITTAIGITITFWIIMSALFLINVQIGNQYLEMIAVFIQQSLAGIFIFFMIIGYIVLFIGTLTGKIDFSKEYEGEEMPRKEKASKKEPGREVHEVQGNGIKRLYRSGRDKILGGVCGGIAEYLQVDPVIIRLIWVIFSLVYGVGILAYIIAWIITPRNPKHKWD